VRPRALAGSRRRVPWPDPDPPFRRARRRALVRSGGASSRAGSCAGQHLSRGSHTRDRSPRAVDQISAPLDLPRGGGLGVV
jgi:hypothetical protein